MGDIMPVLCGPQTDKTAKAAFTRGYLRDTCIMGRDLAETTRNMHAWLQRLVTTNAHGWRVGVGARVTFGPPSPMPHIVVHKMYVALAGV